MRAVVYDSPRNFEVRDVPKPEPGPGELRIRVTQTGFCGTDLHLHVGEFGPRYPLIPGHEVVGTVDALGGGVQEFALGEQITVNPNLHCGRCTYCRAGQLVMCSDAAAFGISRAGFFAEFAVIPASSVFSVEGLDPDVAVFTEPTACAMHGVEVVRPRPGSSALVLGAGPTGLLLAQLLGANGAASVTVGNPTAYKLEAARRLGIDQTVLVEPITDHSAEAVIEQLRAHSPDGDGFDLVVEATGVTAVGNICVPLTRNGGTFLVYGVAQEAAELSIRPYDVFHREISIKGSFAEMTSFGAAIAALRTGRVQTAGIITHRFALEDFPAALEAALTDKSAHKIVIAP